MDTKPTSQIEELLKRRRETEPQTFKLTNDEMVNNIAMLFGRNSIQYYNLLNMRHRDPAVVEYVYKQMVTNERRNVETKIAEMQKRLKFIEQLEEGLL